jgi:hypothetical protein
VHTSVIDALAAYRLTRLVQDDTFPVSKALRAYVQEHGSDKVVEMFECPWCLGFWISVGVVAARKATPKAWQPLASAFATSAVVGIVTTGVKLAQLHLEED